ncbi:MAG TPA: methyl-accepting chemotaxis protein [Pyrinomonadaceae bacterium]|nr:methyl-accepting chemotaxis protein [Pyrinomonadaceae bacterium]
MFFKRNRSHQPGTISVSNPQVRTKIQFHGLTENDLGIIKSWSDICRSSLDRLVDTFYAHVLNSPETSGVLRQHSSVERQRPMLSRYILTLFDGKIDDEYVAYRYKVGQVHDRIALDSHWFVAMYEVIRQFLLVEIEKAGATAQDLKQFRNALDRLLQIDMSFVLMSQADTYKDKIGKLTLEVEEKLQEAQSFLNEEARVLEKVSSRNLTDRMEGDFQGHYANIQKMLNQTIDNLYNSIAQISVGAEQVTSASDEISSASQSLAQSASEQAATLEEMSANFQEMVGLSTRNADNAKIAFEMTQAAHLSTERGGENMNELSEAMTKIKNSSDATAKIVKTIEEIAFQTNLLALNAAVEAARAGDAGKGFAVVAEEVRNLAMRSAEAAKNTAQLIEDSVKNTQSGVKLNEEVLENLTEIRGHVEKVSQMMNDISAESNSQHQNIEHISNAIDQINTATQQVAASSEEAASASEQLAGQSQEMLGLINSYELGNEFKKTLNPRTNNKPGGFSKSPLKIKRAIENPKTNNFNRRGNTKSSYSDSENLIPFDDYTNDIFKEF